MRLPLHVKHFVLCNPQVHHQTTLLRNSINGIGVQAPPDHVFEFHRDKTDLIHPLIRVSIESQMDFYY